MGIFWHNAAETWIDISSNTADKVNMVDSHHFPATFGYTFYAHLLVNAIYIYSGFKLGPDSGKKIREK